MINAVNIKVHLHLMRNNLKYQGTLRNAKRYVVHPADWRDVPKKYVMQPYRAPCSMLKKYVYKYNACLPVYEGVMWRNAGDILE